MKQDVLIVEDETDIQKATYVEEEVDLYADRKIEFSNVVEIVGEKFEDVENLDTPFMIEECYEEEV